MMDQQENKQKKKTKYKSFILQELNSRFSDLEKKPKNYGTMMQVESLYLQLLELYIVFNCEIEYSIEQQYKLFLVKNGYSPVQQLTMSLIDGSSGNIENLVSILRNFKEEVIKYVDNNHVSGEYD